MDPKPGGGDGFAVGARGAGRLTRDGATIVDLTIGDGATFRQFLERFGLLD